MSKPCMYARMYVCRIEGSRLVSFITAFVGGWWVCALIWCCSLAALLGVTLGKGSLYAFVPSVQGGEDGKV